MIYKKTFKNQHLVLNVSLNADPEKAVRSTLQDAASITGVIKKVGNLGGGGIMKMVNLRIIPSLAFGH